MLCSNLTGSMPNHPIRSAWQGKPQINIVLHHGHISEIRQTFYLSIGSYIDPHPSRRIEYKIPLRRAIFIYSLRRLDCCSQSIIELRKSAV